MLDLERTVSTLIELGEPEALVATLRRAAADKARLFERGLIGLGEAKRWATVARALQRAEDELGLSPRENDSGGDESPPAAA